jgi:hypothetical protein
MASSDASPLGRPGPIVELALTLPIFVLYHVGVIFLDVRNATDWVTGPLLRFANGDRLAYVGLTLVLGGAFAVVLGIAGKGTTFRASRFAQALVEGIVLAVLMRLAGGFAVNKVFAAAAPAGLAAPAGTFTNLVMSLGAGFYEEIAFRVILFGTGAKLWVRLFAGQTMGVLSGVRPPLGVKTILVFALWSLACAIAFSGIHYVGSLGDPFEARSFLYRAVLGLVLTLIYLTRGFATAVWAHAIYDVWVLVF